MIDFRKQTGARGPTKGIWTKPGFFYPTPSDPVNDYGLIEHKTVDSKEQPVAYGEAHPTYSALKLTIQKHENAEDGSKNRTRIYRTLPGVAVTRYVYDDEIKEYIAITTQDLAIGTAKPTDPLIIQSQDSPNDEMGWITRTTMKVATANGLPSADTQYKTEQFTFPALLSGVTIGQQTVGEGNVSTGADTVDYLSGINTIYTIKPDLRPAISAPTVHKIETTWFYKIGGIFYNAAGTNVGADQDALRDAVYEILPNVIRGSGRLLDFNFGEVLNNAMGTGGGTALSASAGSNDKSLTGLTETFSFGASVPSCTAYLADVTAGEWKIIASDVERWRASGLYMKRNISIKLR